MTFGVPSSVAKFLTLVLALAAAPALLAGCTVGGAVVGAGAVVGIGAVQERSLGAAIDDTTIQLDVGHRLFQKSEKLFLKVNIEVVEGRVLLTGELQNPEDRIEAARIAWQADGVAEVLNEIQVRDSSTIKDYAKDSWISTRLRWLLLTDRDVHHINYTLETVNGVVYLMGIALDQAELERVTNHARTIRGVRKVVSHVRLRDDARRKPS